MALELELDGERLLQRQVGAALTPLWLTFAAATTAGIAFWSATCWRRLAAPEACAEEQAPAADEAALAVVQPAAPLVAAVETTIEPVVAESTAQLAHDAPDEATAPGEADEPRAGRRAKRPPAI